MAHTFGAVSGGAENESFGIQAFLWMVAAVLENTKVLSATSPDSRSCSLDCVFVAP